MSCLHDSPAYSQIESLPVRDAFDVQHLNAVIVLNADQRHAFGKDGMNAIGMCRRIGRKAGDERQTRGLAIARFFKKLACARFNRAFAFFHAAARQLNWSDARIAAGGDLGGRKARAWIVLVPAEYLGVKSGLGYAINDARDTLEYDRLAAVVLIVGLIGFTFDAGLQRLIQRLSWLRQELMIQ